MFRIESTGVYTTPELADLFQLRERNIWPLLLSGALRGRKIGKRWFVTGADVLAFTSSTESAGDKQTQDTNIPPSPGIPTSVSST